MDPLPLMKMRNARIRHAKKMLRIARGFTRKTMPANAEYAHSMAEQYMREAEALNEKIASISLE